MAAKKTAQAAEAEVTEAVQAEEVKEEQATAPAAPSHAEKENEELKSMLRDMQKMMAQMQTQMEQQQEQIRQMAAGEAAPARPKTQTDIDAEAIRKVAQETAEAGKDPWTVEVEVFVPHRDKGEDRWYWVNINDRSAQIPADDRRQTMKLPFALILTDMLKAKQREEEYIDSIEVYDPKTNPHEGRL